MSINMATYRSRGEWLKHRESYIGGSEAAAIIGQNAYMSNVELWEIKTGRREREDISKKEFVKFGNDAEPSLRRLFALRNPTLKVHYKKNNMWTNTDYPFSHASLDGWTTDKNKRSGILEIKTTNIFQTQQKEKWHEQIPGNYYVQVLHYLAVTGFEYADLFALLNFDTEYSQLRQYHIEREEVEEDIKYLMEQEKAFARYIQDDVRPPLILPA